MRIAQLRAKLAQEQLDGMLITDPLNRRYLSGFSGSAGWLLVTAERSLLAVDFRYYERAAREAPDWEQVQVTTTYPAALAEMVAQAGVVRLGIESDQVTVAQYTEFGEKVPDVELVPLEKLVLPLRAVKDEGEIAAIRAAVACSDAAYSHLCQVIQPGKSELEISWELESYMRQHGASAVSFSTIVGSGPNGAMPHATAGERVVAAGEPIVMDFGAVVDGYCSDITRSLCLGHADERYHEVWEWVLEAQQAAEAELRPGMTGVEADALARDVFARVAQEEQFGHGLGHGVGLAIHEAPRLSRLAEDTILEPGMVVTVEPGLYYPGWGGVRIEDMVVIREDGVEVLTQAAKQPVLV